MPLLPFLIIAGSVYIYEKRHIIKKGFQDGQKGVYDYKPSKKGVYLYNLLIVSFLILWNHKFCSFWKIKFDWIAGN